MSIDNYVGVKRGFVDSPNTLAGYLGQSKMFPNTDPTGTSSVKGLRNGSLVQCRWVLNKSGAVLYAGQVVKWCTGFYKTGVTTCSAITDIACGVVDEFLNSAGVAIGAGFWIVTRGETQMKSDGASTLAENSPLVPSTTAGDVLLLVAAPGTATIAQAAALAVCGFSQAAVANTVTAGTLFLADFQPTVSFGP